MSATLIDLFYIPLLFVVVSRVFKREKSPEIPDRHPDSKTPPETA